MGKGKARRRRLAAALGAQQGLSNRLLKKGQLHASAKLPPPPAKQRGPDDFMPKKLRTILQLKARQEKVAEKRVARSLPASALRPAPGAASAGPAPPAAVTQALTLPSAEAGGADAVAPSSQPGPALPAAPPADVAQGPPQEQAGAAGFSEAAPSTTEAAANASVKAGLQDSRGAAAEAAGTSGKADEEAQAPSGIGKRRERGGKAAAGKLPSVAARMALDPFAKARSARSGRREFRKEKKRLAKAAQVGRGGALDGDGGRDLEAKLQAAAKAPEFGEQALAPIKSSLKRKHWDPAAGMAERCKAVFLAQMTAAKKAAAMRTSAASQPTGASVDGSGRPRMLIKPTPTNKASGKAGGKGGQGRAMAGGAPKGGATSEAARLAVIEGYRDMQRRKVGARSSSAGASGAVDTVQVGGATMASLRALVGRQGAAAAVQKQTRIQ